MVKSGSTSEFGYMTRFHVRIAGELAIHKDDRDTARKEARYIAGGNPLIVEFHNDLITWKDPTNPDNNFKMLDSISICDAKYSIGTIKDVLTNTAVNDDGKF